MENQVLYLQILDLRVYYLLFLCLFYMFTVISQTTLNSLLEKSKLFSNIKKKKKSIQQSVGCTKPRPRRAELMNLVVKLNWSQRENTKFSTSEMCNVHAAQTV